MNMPMIEGAKTGRSESKSKQIVIGIVLLLILIVIIVVLCVQNHNKEKVKALFLQGVADYEACDYVDAVTCLSKTLEYDSEQIVEIVTYLADAYIALEDYETAAELLQKYYKQTNAQELYIKFETTLELLLDAQYEKNFNRGNRYFRAGEYSKALQAYQEAYELKPDSEEVAELMISAYINNNQINEAKEFYNSIKEEFDAETIQHMKDQINQASIHEKYELLISEAEEFFYNGNLDESIAVYNRAICLLPYEIEAYEELVNMYLSLQEYETAMQAIRNYEVKYEYEDLKEVEQYIKEKKEEEEKISNVMSHLYTLLMDGEMKSVISMIKDEEYSKWIQSGQTYYFNYNEQRRSTQIPLKRGIVIYSSGYIYCGAFQNGKRSGEGRYFGLTNDGLGYFLYVGEWADDLPNGEGTLNTVMTTSFQGAKNEYNVIVQGSYRDGYENGSMRRNFYLADQYFGSLEYLCINGIPQPSDINIRSYEITYGYSYDIGKFVTIKGTDEFYYVYTQDKWMVPGL